ncbi:hypothetical protein QJS66_04025 [Kocuria rhizophila]|nr:hypothetical protein QJS66_04025 [Kocuria rhizophila]
MTPEQRNAARPVPARPSPTAIALFVCAALISGGGGARLHVRALKRKTAHGSGDPGVTCSPSRPAAPRGSAQDLKCQDIVADASTLVSTFQRSTPRTSSSPVSTSSRPG